MNILAVIPARWESQRFPGKVLAPIAGVPMIKRVWTQVSRTKSVSDVLVATDNQKVADYCRSENMDVTMTSPDHTTGTDRVAEISRQHNADIYVNVQGDEPLINPDDIEKVVQCLIDARSADIGVATAYTIGTTPDEDANTSVVHLVPDLDGRIITLSRLPVPCAFREDIQRNIHVGLYAFTREALSRFTSWERGPVERAESIELLRFLEHGERIACTRLEHRSIGVDHPEDIEKVEAVIQNQNK